MFQFNARNVQPAMGFEAWPDAWYLVQIIKSNMKPTKDNSPTNPAGYLELVVEAGPGPMQGKTNFIRLNLQNQSQQAVDIAHRTLSAICHVIGVYDVQEMPGPDMCVPMLHNKPFQVHFVPQKNTETGQVGNNAVGFKDANGNDPRHAGAPMAAPQPGQPQQGPQGWQAPPQQQQQPYPPPQPPQGGFQQPQPQPQGGGTAWLQAQPNPPPAPQGGTAWPQQQQQPPAQPPQQPGGWTQQPNANPNAPWR